jgi:hypothetical protein
MANRWTTERGLRQSQPIKTCKPWKSSTGSKTEAGKARASRNADQGLERRELLALRTLLKAQRTQSARTLNKSNNGLG